MNKQHSVIQSVSSGRRKQCIEILIKKGVFIEMKNKELVSFDVGEGGGMKDYRADDNGVGGDNNFMC